MFSFKNFYKPAPATVQRWAALLKIGGAALSTASTSELVPAGYKLPAFLAGLVVCAVAEGLEKLTAAPAPAAGPDPATDPGMKPEDAAPNPPAA